MELKVFQKYLDEDLKYDHTVMTEHRRIGYSAHTHDVPEILFLKEGDINLIIDGNQYRLHKNDLVIIPALSIHEVCLESDRSYERCDVIFSESILQFPFLEELPEGLHVLSFDGNESIISLFKKIDYYLENLEEGAKKKLMLVNLLQEICINVLLSAKTAKTELTARTNPIVSEAIAYIDAHLLELSGIEELCRELFITKSHLHHLFIKHLHVTPKKHITFKRLTIAHREISFGAKPTEVYARCGFSDYSAFYRAYKAQFGYAPSDATTSKRTFYIYNEHE